MGTTVKKSSTVKTNKLPATIQSKDSKIVNAQMGDKHRGTIGQGKNGTKRKI